MWEIRAAGAAAGMARESDFRATAPAANVWSMCNLTQGLIALLQDASASSASLSIHPTLGFKGGEAFLMSH